jgi:hypothetical protein
MPHRPSFGTSRYFHQKRVDRLIKGRLYQYCFLCRLVCLRGGDEIEVDTVNKPSNDIDNVSQLIGIIDVRSQAECDCIILTDRKQTSFNPDTVQLKHSATFSSSCISNLKSWTHDTSTTEEVEQNQGAAAALTIGSSCSTIYLLLTYDFNNGKTVLHRTLGGIKLMNMVDGIRRRWKDSAYKSSRTKLILLLVPSKSYDKSILDCQSNKLFLDLTEDTKWKKEGLSYLIDRLNQYFELGGEEYKCVNPFDLDIVLLGETSDASDESISENIGTNSAIEIFKRHIELHSSGTSDASDEDFVDAKHFESIVGDRFASFGGLGSPTIL